MSRRGRGLAPRGALLVLAVVLAAILWLGAAGGATAVADAVLSRVGVAPTPTLGCGCDLLPQFKDSW